MIKSVQHVGLNVADMARSLAFYRDTLGFPIVQEKRMENGLHLVHVQVTPGCTVELLKRPGEANPVPEPQTLGFVHLAFVVDDLDATYAELRARGIAFTAAPTERVGQGERRAFCKGPDGEVLELVEL